MTNYSAQNVEEFIAESAELARPHLQEIREAVLCVLPESSEHISYGKPYYKHPKHLVGFDAYKQHINFEIYKGQLASDERKELEEKGYKTGNKSFQIRYDQKVPIAMIQKITKTQVSREDY